MKSIITKFCRRTSPRSNLSEDAKPTAIKYLGHIEKIENGLGFFFREEYIANAMHMAVNLAHKYIYHKNIQDFSNTLKSAVNQYAFSV